MSKFSKYVSKCKFEVGGEALDLDIELQDLVNLTAAQDEKDKKVSLGIMIDTFKDILKRSYPEEEIKAIEGFLTQNLIDFMVKFSDALGLQDKAVNTKENQDKVDSMKKRG